jgi:hypothetical protein
MAKIPIAKTVLLTGAGFTANFGGYLAEEMWSLIFSHPKVQKRPLVKQLMLGDFNYESAYYKILHEGTWSSNDQAAILDATRNAYDRLDKAIRQLVDNDQRNQLGLQIYRFLDQFARPWTSGIASNLGN